MGGRWPPLVWTLACAAAGLGLRLLVAGPVSKYGGVALWSCAVYGLVLSVRPALGVRRAALAALALSWLVELFQLTPVPQALASRHVLFRLVLGTTFHAPDLAAYAAGVGLAAAAHALLKRPTLG